MDKQTTLDLFEAAEDSLERLAELETDNSFELTQNLDDALIQEDVIDDVTINTEELFSLADTMQIDAGNEDFSDIVLDDFQISEELEALPSDLIVEDVRANTEEIIKQETEITEDLVITDSNDETSIEIDTSGEEMQIRGMTTAFENMVIHENKPAEEIKIPVDDTASLSSKDDFGKVNIVVIGLGSCGCNAVNRMFADKNADIKLIAMDTSEQTLEAISADQKILIGEDIFKGHGSGGRTQDVELAFDEAKTKIQSLLNNVDMLFLAGGLGRGTGSVGLYRIGNIAREMGVLTIGFATLPSSIEGSGEVCKNYYPKFSQAVDSTILVENDKIAQVAKDLPIKKAMAIADSMLVDGIRGVYELVTKPGKINLDYADIRTAFKDQGTAVMGIGYGTGADGVVDAIREAIYSEIIDIENVRNAKTIIFNITCPDRTVTIDAATRGTDLIYTLENNDSIEHLFFGYSYDNDLKDRVKVTFIATGTQQSEIDFDRKPMQTNKFVGIKPTKFAPKVNFEPVDSKPINLNEDTKDLPLFGTSTPEKKQEEKSEAKSMPSFFKR